MPPEAQKLIFDAIKACDAITQFTNGKSINHYSSDLMLRSAVERQFEILGEAFSKLDAIDSSFRVSHPPIGRIIGMRNRIIHGYDSVDDAIIWNAINEHVPGLLVWLRSLQ